MSFLDSVFFYRRFFSAFCFTAAADKSHLKKATATRSRRWLHISHTWYDIRHSPLPRKSRVLLNSHENVNALI